MVEMAMFNVQRAITPNVGTPELRFLCYAHCLMMLYIYVKFRKISRTLSELWSGHEYMVEMAMFNVQRAIIPKVGKPKLRFMCSAHRLIVVYIAVKFRENIKMVSERIKNSKARTDTQNFGRYKMISRQFLWRGIKNISIVSILIAWCLNVVID